jgi:hypothetical protein
MTGGNFLNLSGKELDRHVYRIMPQDYVFSLFSERQNVLSRVHNWKDKFENFQLKLGGTLDGEQFDYGFRDAFVGQCWTQDGYSEAMWGIYANDPSKRFLRIRSTPRKLLRALAAAHPDMPQDTCFFGRVSYKKEAKLKAFALEGGLLDISSLTFAEALLLKRHAFRHEREVRLLHFGDVSEQDERGLYRYPVDPHVVVTQIMADPNRDRHTWAADKVEIKRATGFAGAIKRSMIYDPPNWGAPIYSSLDPKT